MQDDYRRIYSRVDQSRIQKPVPGELHSLQQVALSIAAESHLTTGGGVQTLIGNIGVPLCCVFINWGSRRRNLESTRVGDMVSKTE